MKRYENWDWKKVAGWLQECGYTRMDQPETIHGAIFTKSGEETLYLYRPQLADYTVEYVDRPQPADLERKIVYLPEYYRNAAGEAYLWAPRALSSKPKLLFKIPEVAEHVGVSTAWLKQEIYNFGRIQLIDGHNRFGDRLLFPESDIVNWEKGRQNVGHPRTRRQHKPKGDLVAIPA